MGFKKLAIANWKQFEKVDVEFHPRLTVLTGANGSGKTTILNLLSRHFGWNYQELSTPAKDKKTGRFKFFTRFFKKSHEGDDKSIGLLTYSDGKEAKLKVPDSNAAQYQVQMEGQQSMAGFHIPSLRPVFTYTQVNQLSTRKREKKQAFDLVSNSYKNREFGGRDRPSNFYIKETLLTWAIYGYGNEVIERDDEQMEYYRGFQRILGKILPKTLGFNGLAIRNSEVVLITDSGDFMLDAVSGGVSALIDLSWHVYMYLTKEKEPFTVLIDEVENHLHASMQRELLGNLLGVFPSVQFIVATHSPLIVGSVRESCAYALRYNENNKVYSERLDLVNKAKSASEILREVLGVPFTMPVWVEEKLNDIVNRYSERGVSRESIADMRKELTDIGLGELVPEAISSVVDKKSD